MERRSKQKEEIKRILQQKNFHPTIEELYEIVKQRIPGVGIATVYRNIEKMLLKQEIIKLDIPGQASRIDGNTEKHYHFRCTSCGHIEDVWLELPIEKHIRSIEKSQKAEVHDHTIEFSGYCSKCLRAD